MFVPLIQPLAIWLLWNSCFIPVHSLPENSALLKKAACKRLANPIKNGGFDSGTLAPWSIRRESTAGASSISLQPGDNSKGSAQLHVSGSIADLYQNISLCQGAVYEVSYSLYQVPKKAKFPASNPNSLNLFVDVKDPNGGSYGPDDFQMHKKYYTQGGLPDVHHLAGKWTSYSYSYTVQKSGVGEIIFSFIVSDADSSGEWRFDNVAMTLQS